MKQGIDLIGWTRFRQFPAHYLLERGKKAQRHRWHKALYGPDPQNSVQMGGALRNIGTADEQLI
jgi:hypothetical protein